MKWLQRSICIVLLFPLFAASSCTKDETYNLQLGESSYVFPADGGEHTVNVSTKFGDGWTVEFDQDQQWLTEKGRTDGSITFVAAPNSSIETDRELTVTFTAGGIVRKLTLSQDFILSSNLHFVPSILGVSRNGRYIATVNTPTVDNQLINEIYLIDTKTDEKTFVAREDRVDMSETSLVETVHISDDGKMVVYSINAGGFFYSVVVKDGVSTAVTPVTGYTSETVHSISADGSVMVGMATNPETGYVEPVKWTNGVPELLDRPLYERVASETEVRRASAVSISGDGNFIVGRVQSSTAEVFYWKNGGEWEWLGEIKSEEIQTTNPIGMPITLTVFYGPKASSAVFSPNNKYLAIEYEAWGVGLIGASKVTVPALYNTETEEFDVILSDIVEESPTGGWDISVTDAGGLFYTYNDITRQTFYLIDGVSEPADEYIESLNGGLYYGENLEILRFSENPFLVIGIGRNNGVVTYFYARNLGA